MANITIINEDYLFIVYVICFSVSTSYLIKPSVTLKKNKKKQTVVVEGCKNC